MISALFRKKKDDKSLLQKGDRHNVFRIERIKNDHGFYIYVLENTAEKKKILIPRFVFGRLRACVRDILNEEINTAQTNPFERSVDFLNNRYFFFKSSRMDLDNLIIQDIEERKGSSGYITVSRRCMPALEKLLYNEALGHPNDVLNDIIAYHKLFQFSFVKGSKSMNSDLALRKDIMQSVVDYKPRQTLASTPVKMDSATTAPSTKTSGPTAAENIKTKTAFASKLGERFHEKNIKVDYSAIFGERKVAVAADTAIDEDDDSKTAKTPLAEFPTSLSTAEIKAFKHAHFHFELSPEKSNELRNRFLHDRQCDFYLGFEIIDTLFTFKKKLKSFQFPLYYMKINIRESGRLVHIDIEDDGKTYLNHLALAHLVEKFSEKSASTDKLENFFNTLLAQHISVDSLNDRIVINRHLPIAETIFDRTREVLFGYKDENGKGGILSALTFDGIETNLNSVVLYRAPKLLAPVEQALEHDLNSIDRIAHQHTHRFYQSLLGQFLTPELKYAKKAPSSSLRRISRQPADTHNKLTWVPGCMPKSSQRLFNKLAENNIVLLEGPPGTGKTHTIMNLLINSVCKRERVLIVSDQQGAIEALQEKMQAYVLGHHAGNTNEQKLNTLLFSAIKVFTGAQTDEQTLADLLDNLNQSLKTHEPEPQPLNTNLSNKMAAIHTRIREITDNITNAVQATMGLPATDTQPEHKPTLSTTSIHAYTQISKADNRTDSTSLIEFLSLIHRSQPETSAVIDGFIQTRSDLLQDDMASCYTYFRLPSANLAHEISALERDLATLALILSKQPADLIALQTLIHDTPQHEITQYLEQLIQQQQPEHTSTLKTVTRRLRSETKPLFITRLEQLQAMLLNQVALLNYLPDWSEGLVAVLNEIHENLRLHQRPHIALGLYYHQRKTSLLGINKGANTPDHAFINNLDAHDAIQSQLQTLEDLYQQQDALVYQQFVTELHRISYRATTEHGQGTNAITRIQALIDSLKQFDTIGASGAVFNELQQALYQHFPIWVTQKQFAPLILPCTEQSIDLVIIDEATQCRVDDALSLLFRAKKILVVGDEKQTVLQKDSSVDDYLFKDRELDEHLRSTQARGFKGGGSNIFSLIKSIKQASVMLDEHYRCPPDIIQYSNKYVYDNALKIMQWKRPKQAPAVMIDNSEADKKAQAKPTSGKYKGIETKMIDHFFDYVGNSIEQIEAQTGQKIRLDTDIALCYFLLKNEPYVKHAKEKFIAKMDRGDSLLDGAGAALQGKERDYIFYLWDITRYNMGAFKQGDDEDKRKGELNVLMSRPKKKAFHFLHRNFLQLDHGRCNITQYLNHTLVQQNKSELAATQERSPSKGTLPEGEQHTSHCTGLFSQLLQFNTAVSDQRALQEIHQQIKNAQLNFCENIVIGDARKEIDLAIYKTNSNHAIGLVDLSAFNTTDSVGQDIVDYYFQVKRATPKLKPVFIYPFELNNENSPAFRALVENLLAVP